MVGELVWRHPAGPGPDDEWPTPLADAIARALVSCGDYDQRDRDERRLLDHRHWWARELLWLAGGDGALPLEVLDAVVHHPDASPGVLGSLASGDLETLLGSHADRYAAGLDERVRTDAAWREVLSGVCVDREVWDRLPAALSAVVPEPPRDVPSTPARTTRAKKTSRPGISSRRKG